MKFNLIVTQQDIEKGVINSKTADPIALAFTRKMGYVGVRVSRKAIYWTDPSFGPMTARLPEKALDLLWDLEYRDRHEALPLVRKGGKDSADYYHDPLILQLEGMMQ